MTLFDADGEPHGDGAAAGPDEVAIYFDGGSRGNPGPAAIGAVVFDGLREPRAVLASVSEAIGVTTNNVAEYKALIAGLEAAHAMHARAVQVRGDSKLVIEQVEGRWKVKQAHLRPLCDRARSLLDDFDRVDIAHVRREFNRDADALVNAALDLA
ncbi:MAG: ribonuclease HI family protein [Acidimicrobiia bacterium]